MRVRRPVLGFLILLHCAALFAVEAVVVQTPATKLVPTLQWLHDVCGPDGDFDACTRFVAYRLDVKCVSASGSAAMNASVTFRPLIFLYSMRQLPHELLHIDDVRRFASEYADAIEKLRFSSSTECQDESIRLLSGFGTKMREFATRSNLERHPTLIANRRDRSTMP